MSFAWPWCFLLLPLPWLVRRWLAPAGPAVLLRLPALPARSRVANPLPPSRWLRLFLAALAWGLLVAAAARPQLPGPPEAGVFSGRDLMLAIDLSASMGVADLGRDSRPLTRLQAAKDLAREFSRRRQGDRLGLIVFGSQAYLHTPLTLDLEAVAGAIDSLETGLAGRETALGDAIALAAKHLDELPRQQRVLVLLSDGANTAGNLSPGRAAWLAQRAGVRLHALAIGKPGQDSGQDPGAGLEAMATRSGGFFARASDRDGLAAFFQHLEQLEALPRSGPALSRVDEVYCWPLGAALFLALGLVLLPGVGGRGWKGEGP